MPFDRWLHLEEVRLRRVEASVTGGHGDVDGGDQADTGRRTDLLTLVQHVSV